VIGVFLLLATAVPAAVTDAADDANLAYVQCLFATSRTASGDRLSIGAFEQRLANACLAQQSALERALAKSLARRGERNSAARAHGLADAARRTVVEDYRHALELEPQLKRIGEMCQAHPEQCRD
jgi:hypothetical protein